jgi:FlaA1/EpsC-like NDP-sugar epimerase
MKKLSGALALCLLRHRRITSDCANLLLAAAAFEAAFVIRFDFYLEPAEVHQMLVALPLLLILKLILFRALSLSDLTWQYSGFEDLTRIANANLAASLTVTAILRITFGASFPRSIYILDFLLCVAFMIIVRGVIRLRDDHRLAALAQKGRRRIVIYGAGTAGITVLSEIRSHPELGYQVMGFIDDDPTKQQMRLGGVKVLGSRNELGAFVRKERLDEVLLAIPTATGPQVATILEQCHAVKVPVKRIPALSELIEHKVLVDQIREVRLEDLLGRRPVQLEEGDIRACLTGKTVLVTGAGGSIGSELCRQIARFRPAVLVGLDNAETALYQIDQDIRENFPDVVFHPALGSVQNNPRLEEIFAEYRPSVVYHAAAYKHVPMMESHMFEAVENNVFGTRNVALAAAAFGARSFVLVSTDKAVRPTNIMGATKSMAELVCLEAGASNPHVRFMAVRFGNVLGSNGSVIPRFRRQIAAGGPVTVTHPEMRRFFMTIPEAAQLVLQASAMGAGGEVFVLDMGEPVRIVDLARKMVLLSGLRPDEDIRIDFSGIRPGEKLYEEVCASEEDTVPTPHSQIRIFTGRGVASEELSRCLEELSHHVQVRDGTGLILCLKEMIRDYNPSTFVLRRVLERNGPRREIAAARKMAHTA